MSWSFETSLLAFLLIAFASQALAAATRGRLSLQFAFGLLCAAGFAFGLLPADLATKSRMRDVGFIAFNVLVVHSGTLVDIKAMRAHRGAAATGLACVAGLALALGLGLAPFLGREAALFSIGPVFGGGAACAISSNVAARRLPSIAALPWVIFMFQGFFGLPLLAFSLRAEVRRLAAPLGGAAAGRPSDASPARESAGAGRVPDAPPSSGRALWERVPASYRGAAYYLASLMLVAALNRLLYGAFLARLGLHPALSALALGALFARLGLLERDPLSKAESMGILMLGLMALMADALAATPTAVLLRLAPTAIAALAAGTAVAAAVGAAAGRISGAGIARGLVVASSCMIGLPTATIVARGMLRGLVRDDGQRAAIAAELLPSIDIVSTLVTNVAAIAVAGAVGIFV